MPFPPLRTNGSGGLAFKFLTVQREQVSETLGKDWIFCVSRCAERVGNKLPWEADVLPLHHSREITGLNAITSVFGSFRHCN